MSDFDLVIRNGSVATVSDVMRRDVDIRLGKIAALGMELGRGAEELDAAARIRRARERGLRIYGETYPQYLFLPRGASKMARPAGGHPGRASRRAPQARDKESI